MQEDWELTHVGILVGDLEEALNYYLSLGIGVRVSLGITPETGFEAAPRPPESERGRPTEVWFYGERFETTAMQPKTEEEGARGQGRLQIGDLNYEVLRSGPGGRDPNSKFFESHGEGISHICFNVPNIKEETDKLVEKGCQIALSFGLGEHTGENYMDTTTFGGWMFSMRQPASESYRAWDAKNRAYDGVANWRFRGIGMPVRDLDKAVEYYESLGIATLQPEAMLDSSACEDFTAYGKTPATTVKVRTRIAQIGPMACEFVQPLEGETMYNESISRRADGIINNITFAVDDVDKETAKIVEKGGQVILSGKPQTGSAFAYFDTRKHGNTMVKLVEAE